MASGMCLMGPAVETGMEAAQQRSRWTSALAGWGRWTHCEQHGKGKGAGDVRG